MAKWVGVNVDTSLFSLERGLEISQSTGTFREIEM